MTSTMDLLYSSDPAEVLASFDSISAAARATAAEVSAAFDVAGDDATGMGAKMDAASAMSAESMAMPAAAAATMAEDTKAAAQDAADGLSVVPAAAKDAAEDTKAAAQDASDTLKATITDASDVAGGALSTVGSKAEDAGSKVEEATTKAASSAEKSGGGVKSALSNMGVPSAVLNGWVALGAGVAAGAAVAVHAATEFQSSMTQLVTGAGESQKNIGLVSSGILSMAGQVGQSADSLAKGMYMVESAGFHGAQGLDVLKASAQGAAVGGAQMSDVANAVTSVLNSYGLSGKSATSVTNQLVATVASGKMHMQDLATAIANVLPTAAAAHISFAQLGGSIATMTAGGMSARRASMGLNNMITAFLKPSSQASQEMKNMGLNATSLSENLGKNGITGTLSQLTDAILKNTKGGTVAESTFNQMGPAAKGLAEQILGGTITTKNLTTAMQGLSPTQAKLVSDFQSSATSATGLKQTFAGAMDTMVGGSTGLRVALDLTGTHAKTLAANVKTIGAAAAQTGGQVEGFSAVQGDLKFKLESAKDAVGALLIRIGTGLIPVLSDVMGVVATLIPIIGGTLVTAFDVVKDTITGTISVVEHIVDWFKQASAPALAVAAVLTVTLGPAFVALAAQAATALAGMVADAATAFATMAGDVVAYIELQGEQLVEGAADMVTFAVEHAVMAASFIVENVAMAASATAAFIAENAATLGIVAGIAALVAGIVYVATHWKQTWDAIKEAATAVWHALDAVWHSIESDAKSIWGDIESHLKEVIEVIVVIMTGGLAVLPALIYTYWGQIESGVESAWNDIKGYIRDAWNVIKTIFMDASIVGLIYSHWTAIESDAKSAWSSILSFLSAIPGDIKGYFGDALKWLEDAGKNIVQGLINGIEGMVGKAVGEVKSLADKMKNEVTSGFGLWSPSRVMHGYGQNIVQGLANGIAENAGLATSATAALAKQMKSIPFTVAPSVVASAIAAGGTANAGAVTAASPAAGAGAAAGTTVLSPTINLNGLNFQNEQQLAAAMRQEMLTLARQLPGRTIFGQYA